VNVPTLLPETLSVDGSGHVAVTEVGVQNASTFVVVGSVTAAQSIWTLMGVLDGELVVVVVCRVEFVTCCPSALFYDPDELDARNLMWKIHGQGPHGVASHVGLGGVRLLADRRPDRVLQVLLLALSPLDLNGDGKPEFVTTTDTYWRGRDSPEEGRPVPQLCQCDCTRTAIRGDTTHIR
jgi:hypothetical protein